MDPNENQTVVEAEADQTLSPSVTEGGPSSEPVDDAPESAAAAMRAEFMEAYGEADPEETDDAVETDDAGDAEGAEAKTDEPDAAEDTQDPKEEPLSADTDDDEDDQFRIPDEQFKALPDGVKKRLGHLNARAKKAERELTGFEERIAPLEEKGGRFDQLQTFVQTNKIEPENVTLAFDAMAKMSAGDFQGFLDAVGPWYQHAQQAVGAVIAPDLQQRVDDGYLTEDDAKELTQARVKADVSESRANHYAEQAEKTTKAETAQAAQQGVLSAINAREAHFKSSDPDYALKSAAIASMVEFAISSGNVPKTAEDAVKKVNDAHARVTASFAKPAPKPKPTPPRVNASNPASANPQPKSASDAMFLGMRGGTT